MEVAVRRLTARSERATVLLCGTVTCVMCFCFLVFVLTIACSQYEALVTSTPGIDALRNKPLTTRRGIVEALTAVCGERPSHRWLLLPIRSARFWPLRPHQR